MQSKPLHYLKIGVFIILIGITSGGLSFADSLPHVGFFSPERVWTAAGNANLNLRQPDPRAGDLLVALLAIRPSTSTINTPVGWTSLGNWVGTDGGAEGVDAGSVRLYWFYKVATGSEGTSNQTFTENGTTNVWQGTIVQLRSSTGTYDLSADAYSINGDNANWNGTLPSNIGLTAGDLVILAGAQNGNLANSSNWNISATGITNKGTVLEHGEFSTTTGNDQETGIATTHIRAGTATAIPTITLTQSAAVSGVVSALRVRQGAGTNRLDSWVRAAGSQVTGTADSLAIPYSEHEVGDMLITFIANRYDTATPTTPTNWTSLGTYTGGIGSNLVDSGTARITAFYRQATSEFTGTQAVSITGDNVSTGQMITVHRDDVDFWILDSDGGADNTADTTWSATGTGLDLNSRYGGDIILLGNSINTDAYLYSNHALSASGISFGDVTQTAEYRSASGNDNTLELVTGRVSSGNLTNVIPTFTSTSSGSTVNAPTGATIFIKVLGRKDPVFSQGYFRWYADNDAADPVSSWGTPGLAENAAITIFPAGNDPPSPIQKLRLRMNFSVSEEDLIVGTEYFKLQWRAGTDSDCTSGTWTDVGTGNAWEYASSSVSDGSSISALLSNTTSGKAQKYVKSSGAGNSLNSVDAYIGEISEYDFHIVGTNELPAQRYLFRVVETDATGATTLPFLSYTNCPALTTEPGADLLMRHGNIFYSGVESGFFWAN